MPDPQNPSNPVGRPKIGIDYAVFDSLCQIHCTKAEIAAVLQCSEDTLERRVEEDHRMKFAAYYASRAILGRASLRRDIWEAALDKRDVHGNVTREGKSDLKKLLAKQKEQFGGLGFSDRMTTEHEIGEGSWEQLMGLAKEIEDTKKSQEVKRAEEKPEEE